MKQEELTRKVNEKVESLMVDILEALKDKEKLIGRIAVLTSKMEDEECADSALEFAYWSMS